MNIPIAPPNGPLCPCSPPSSTPRLRPPPIRYLSLYRFAVSRLSYQGNHTARGLPPLSTRDSEDHCACRGSFLVVAESIARACRIIDSFPCRRIFRVFPSLGSKPQYLHAGFCVNMHFYFTREMPWSGFAGSRDKYIPNFIRHFQDAFQRGWIVSNPH